MKQTAMLVLALGLAAGTLLGSFLVAQDRGKKPAGKPSPAAPPLSVAVEHGETVLAFSPEAQRRLGLVVEQLKAISTHEQLRAAAVVLPAGELVQLRSGYVATLSKLEQARANGEVTRKEYERLERLYAENENASLKAVQAAEGKWRANRAAERAAEQQLALASLQAKQRWGGVVAGWLANDSPKLERVLNQREMLVQVTLPPSQPFIQPARADLETPAGKLVRASLVSLFPRTEPRIQGISLLYRAPTRPGIVPGATLVALLAHGREMRGAAVPESAVVWKDGSAWVYQEIAAGQFARRAVSTDFRLGDGYFVRNFEPGDRIVVSGAEVLLSAGSMPGHPAKEDED